ncbi:MAG TPA: ABC transporter substrate-binding protein [Bradyrhizobium sp.]|jgi:putative ABC transport system substrate-binding protein|nr:ABC transporter substrate-binding protein [Bradyrhizobium sp.]
MTVTIGRRELLAALGGAVAAWPRAARAQQPALPVVGFIRTTSADDSLKLVEAFRRGLGEAGYVEGRNVLIEYRYAQGQIDRLPALAADLVTRRVAVLAATGGTVSARAAKAATSTIPVVFTTGDDPVKAGLVASLSRPGGNVTGVSVFTARLGAKRLALLHELIPAATTIAILLNPKNPDSEDEAKDVQEAARALGVEILVLYAGTENEIDAAFTKLVEQRTGALMLGADTFFTSQRARIATLSTYLRIPTADSVREFPEAGGFASYGASLAGVYRQAGVYVGRILKGDKPADLPVLLPTAFEFVINLQTAKVIGLTVPDKLLVAADEVIE